MNAQAGGPPAGEGPPAAFGVAAWSFPIQLAILSAAYFAAARLGLTFAVLHQSASAVWPPTGLALAALILYGARLWPGVFAGAFLANLVTSHSVGASLGIAAGNTLEAVAGAWLIHRVAGGAPAFARTSGVFRCALIAGLSAPVIGASVGVLSLWLLGLLPDALIGSVWVTWWLGDGAGAVVFAPFLIAWALPAPAVSDRRDRMEILVLGTLAAAAGVIAVTGLRGYPLEFVFVPVVLWAALRFGQRAALTSVVGFSAVAVWSTLSGEGPFGRLPPNDVLLYVQGFVAVLAVMGAAVGALSAEHAALRLDLEQRVADRTAALRTSEASLNEAQSLAHLGSWEWHVTTNVVRWSDELCRIYGVAPGTMPSFEEFVTRVHPADRDRVQTVVQAGMASGQPFAFEHRIVRPDGVTRTMAARGRVIHDAAGRPIRLVGTGQDVTDRRRAEAQQAALEREQGARREAEEASRMKDQFLAMISHELRTPLNAVLGWAQMLTERPPAPDELQKGLQVIERNALAQQRLIEDLLDVSEFTQGRLRVASERVDFALVTAAAIESVSLAAAAKRIRVHSSIAPEIFVRGDRQRLQQVVWNLLANAVKFTPAGGRIAVVAAGADGAGTGARLRVTDSGVGITADALPHVFTTFWRGQSEDNPQGLGLGLAIVRAFVEAHGGTVEASSDGADCGTSFEVQLPLAD